MKDDLEKIKREIELLKMEQEKLKLEALKKRQSVVLSIEHSTKSAISASRTILISLFGYIGRWIFFCILLEIGVAVTLAEGVDGFSSSGYARIIQLPFLLFNDATAYTIGEKFGLIHEKNTLAILIAPTIASFISWKTNSSQAISTILFVVISGAIFIFA